MTDDQRGTRLQGRYALVTGGSRGIGRAVAERFAAEGAVVAINHFGDEAEAEAALAALLAVSPGHVVEAADVGDAASCASLVERVVAGFGRLDILVNNAGIQSETPGDGFDAAEMARIVAVNLLGPAHCARAAIRHFLERPGGGVVLNTSSVHERIPKPGYLGYSVSKGGLGNLTRTLALEFADRGVRVNAVAPGATLTSMNRSWAEDAEQRAVVEGHIPMGRAATPEELAPIYAFLASEEASYITGQTIYACGGLTLYGDFKENWAS